MSWQFLVAISVLSSSVVIPFQRVLLHRDKSDPIAFVIASQALTAVLITLGHVEASIFSTLLNTNTIWIVLMGYVVFQEQPHSLELLGTLLILASVGMLAEGVGRLRLEKNVWMGLLIGLIFGLAASAWIYVGKDSDVVTWTAVSFAGTSLIVLLLKPSSVRKMKPFLGYGILTKMLFLAAFWAISNLASLAAYQHGAVSTFAAIVCFVGVLLIIA